MKLGVDIPCYNEEEVIEKTNSTLNDLTLQWINKRSGMSRQIGLFVSLPFISSGREKGEAFDEASGTLCLAQKSR